MFRFPPLNRFLKALLSILFVAYVAQVLLVNWALLPVTTLMALQVGEPGVWTLWQVFTYPIAFDTSTNGFLGFLINLVFAWLIVGQFQQANGTRRTLQLAVFVTLACAGTSLLLSPFVGPGSTLFGLGQIIWACIAVLAWQLRGRTLHLFGAIPMKGEQLLTIGVVFAVVWFLVSADLVSLVASLTAIGAGVLFARYMARPKSRKKRKKPKSGRGGPFDVIPGGREDTGSRWLN